MKELTELKQIDEGQITNANLASLEPYRAKHAVFIAADFVISNPKIVTKYH